MENRKYRHIYFVVAIALAIGVLIAGRMKMGGLVISFGLLTVLFMWRYYYLADSVEADSVEIDLEFEEKGKKKGNGITEEQDYKELTKRDYGDSGGACYVGCGCGRGG